MVSPCKITCGLHSTAVLEQLRRNRNVGMEEQTAGVLPMPVAVTERCVQTSFQAFQEQGFVFIDLTHTESLLPTEINSAGCSVQSGLNNLKLNWRSNSISDCSNTAELSRTLSASQLKCSPIRDIFECCSPS